MTDIVVVDCNKEREPALFPTHTRLKEEEEEEENEDPFVVVLLLVSPACNNVKTPFQLNSISQVVVSLCDLKLKNKIKIKHTSSNKNQRQRKKKTQLAQ